MICGRCHKKKLGVPKAMNTLGMDLCFDCIGELAMERRTRDARGQ